MYKKLFKKLPAFFLLLCLIFLSIELYAAQKKVESIGITEMGLDEAKNLASELLSPEGNVVKNVKDSTLIIIDYPDNIKQIQELFSGITTMPAKNIQIEISFTGKSSFRKTKPFLKNTPHNLTISNEKNTQMLVVSNGRTAHLHVGEEVAEPEWFFMWAADNGLIAQEFKYRKVGSLLAVTPRILGRNIIEITVTPELSFYLENSKEKRIISVKKLSTTVLVQNGATISIGGISSGRNEFTSKFYTATDRSSKINITLTPKIIN